MNTPCPPRFFLNLFRRFCDPTLLPYIEGDLLELYQQRVKSEGKKKAGIKFIFDVILLFRPGILRSIATTQSLTYSPMLRNYFKVGIRNLLKYKAFSVINIFGLSAAMCVCMLVILMFTDQLRYDKFHTKGDRIFRILSERPYSSTPFASTPPSLASILRDEYADVETATHLVIGVGGEARSDRSTIEMRGFFADEHFLEVFDFTLQTGNKHLALTSPNSLVITAEVAKNLFGEKDPLGESVVFTDRKLHYLKTGKDSPPVEWGTFTITGVLSEKDMKSHLKFDVLMSASTTKTLASDNKLDVDQNGWDKSFTYVLSRSGKTQEDLVSALNDLTKRKYSTNEPLKDFRLTPQPLFDITPGIMVNQPPSFQLPIEPYYFLGLIALAIMLSACLNYTNLSTARALTRAKEIGIRKVTGARRKDLILQFLSESVLTAFFSLALATALMVVIKPAFTGLWLNRYLEFDLESGVWVYLVFGIFALSLGIVSGLYPALRLSAFQPARAIKNLSEMPATRFGMRKILSVSQFVISLFFVITSILIYTQFRYFMNFDYGFNPKNIVNVELQGNSFNRISESFRDIPGVVSISVTEYVPATGRTSGMEIAKPNSEDIVPCRFLPANENFIPTMKLKMIAGRNLPETRDSASRQIVVNESAVKAFGFESANDIVGATLVQNWNKEELEVVGVVQDFSLKLPIGGEGMEPAFLRNQPGSFSFANVKIGSADIAGTLTAMATKWKRLDVVHPFKYRFYEDELTETHAGIFDAVSIAGFLAFIAVTIACLGMLGMATYTAERKTKEVGIRKVLGAESLSIAFMLSKEFLKIILIAILIGAPLTWFVNNLWLQGFAYRAEFGFTTVLAGTMILVTLGLITIGSQTLRVSRTNPVDTLKAE